MHMYLNGHQLYIERHGPGNDPALVLLHHGLGSTRAWKGQVTALAGAGWQIVAYDRWGYGRSDPRPGIDIPSFQQDQQDLLSLLDLLALQRVVLVGHSDGGTIALYLAARYPLRVLAVVSVAAHVYVERKMQPGIESVRHIWEHDERFRRSMYKVHGEKFEMVFSNWYHGWCRPEIIGWDMRPEIARVACPVFVVQGSEDEHATPQHASDIAACIPGSVLWLAHGAAHMLPQEIPDVFNARLGEFLACCLDVRPGVAQDL